MLSWRLLSLVSWLLVGVAAENIGPYLQECFLGPGSLDASVCTVTSLGFPAGYQLSGKRHASLVRVSAALGRRDVQIQVLFDDLDLHPLSNITFHSGPSENATRYQFTVRGRHRLLHHFTDPVVIVLFSAGQGIFGNSLADSFCDDHVGFKARFSLIRTSKRIKMPPYRVDSHYISGLYDEGFVDETFPHPNRARSWLWFTDTTWIIRSPPGFPTYAKITNLVPSSVNSDTYLEARAGNNSESPLLFRRTSHAELQITRWRGAVDIVSQGDLYVRFHGMTDQSRYFKMIYTTFSILKANDSCESVFERELSMEGFYCKRQGQCIPRRYVCDSLPHCVEGYDEYGTVCDAPLQHRVSLCTDGRPFRCPAPDLRCVYSLNECHPPEYYDVPSGCTVGNCSLNDGYFTLGGPMIHGGYPRWRSYYVVQWLFISLLSLVAMGLCVIYFGYRQRLILGSNPAYSITGGITSRSLGSTSATLSATRRSRRDRQVTLVFYDAFRDDSATQQLTEHQETSRAVVCPPPYMEQDRPPSYHSERADLPPSYDQPGAPLNRVPPSYDQPGAPLNRVKPPSYAEAVGT